MQGLAIVRVKALLSFLAAENAKIAKVFGGMARFFSQKAAHAPPSANAELRTQK